MLDLCWFSFSLPGRYVADSHWTVGSVVYISYWTVGSVGSISYLHGLKNKKTLAHAGNRTKAPLGITTIILLKILFMLTQLPLLTNSCFIQRRRGCVDLRSVQLDTFSSTWYVQFNLIRSFQLDTFSSTWYVQFNLIRFPCLLHLINIWNGGPTDFDHFFLPIYSYYLSLDAFESLRKVTISFVRCVCPTVRPSVCPHGRTRLQPDEFSWNVKYGYFSKIRRNIQVWLNSEKKSSNLRENLRALVVISHWFALRIKNVSYNICREI